MESRPSWMNLSEELRLKLWKQEYENRMASFAFLAGWSARDKARQATRIATERYGPPAPQPRTMQPRRRIPKQDRSPQHLNLGACETCFFLEKTTFPDDIHWLTQENPGHPGHQGLLQLYKKYELRRENEGNFGKAQDLRDARITAAANIYTTRTNNIVTLVATVKYSLERGNSDGDRLVVFEAPKVNVRANKPWGIWDFEAKAFKPDTYKPKSPYKGEFESDEAFEKRMNQWRRMMPLPMKRASLIEFALTWSRADATIKPLGHDLSSPKKDPEFWDKIIGLPFIITVPGVALPLMLQQNTTTFGTLSDDSIFLPRCTLGMRDFAHDWALAQYDGQQGRVRSGPIHSDMRWEAERLTDPAIQVQYENDLMDYIERRYEPANPAEPKPITEYSYTLLSPQGEELVKRTGSPDAFESLEDFHHHAIQDEGVQSIDPHIEAVAYLAYLRQVVPVVRFYEKITPLGYSTSSEDGTLELRYNLDWTPRPVPYYMTRQEIELGVANYPRTRTKGTTGRSISKKSSSSPSTKLHLDPEYREDEGASSRAACHICDMPLHEGCEHLVWCSHCGLHASQIDPNTHPGPLKFVNLPPGPSRTIPFGMKPKDPQDIIGETFPVRERPPTASNPAAKGRQNLPATTLRLSQNAMVERRLWNASCGYGRFVDTSGRWPKMGNPFDFRRLPGESPAASILRKDEELLQYLKSRFLKAVTPLEKQREKTALISQLQLRKAISAKVTEGYVPTADEIRGYQTETESFLDRLRSKLKHPTTSQEQKDSILETIKCYETPAKAPQHMVWHSLLSPEAQADISPNAPKIQKHYPSKPLLEDRVVVLDEHETLAMHMKPRYAAARAALDAKFERAGDR